MSSLEHNAINIRNLLVRILIAFVMGVCSVLIVFYVANQKAKQHAAINARLDEVLNDCGKQKIISQYLTKNVLLLDETDNEHNADKLVNNVDSVLAEFHTTHQRIAASNTYLESRSVNTSIINILFSKVEPEVRTLIKSSYGSLEENSDGFKESILMHETTFLPLMDSLTTEYQNLTEISNQEFLNIINRQYWFIAGMVVLAATVVFIFSVQLIQGRFRMQKRQIGQILKDHARYDGLIRGSRDLVFELDENSNYTFINPSVHRVTGYSIRELNDKKWTDHILPSHKSEVIRFYKNAVKNKDQSVYFEFPILNRDNQLVWLGQSSEFSYGEEGKLLKAYNIARDITKSKQLQFNEAKYREGLRLLNELAAQPAKSIQKRLEEGLKLCVEFLGLESGIVSEVWMDEYKVLAFYPEDSGLKINQKFKLGNTFCDIMLGQKEKVLIIDKMSQSDYKSHPCFTNFPLESYIGAAYRVNGKVFGTVNFTSQQPREKAFSQYDTDFIALVARWVGTVIEQHESQEKIKQEQNLLKTFVANAPVAIAMFDKHMHYISASKRWLTDQQLEGNIIGKSHYKVFPNLNAEWKEMHKRALNGEVIKPGIERFQLSNGSTRWVQGEIHPWYTNESKIGGIIIVVNDLTDLKNQEEELRQAKEEAEAAGNIKEEFLSTMSHEIRTPLNAIIGTTNLLEMEHPELSNSSRMKMLKFGSNNLLNLINDVLDFQKIESGNLDIVESDFNLIELVDNIIETWKGVSGENKVELNLEVDEKLSNFYIGDEVRLTQILNNLISNALKFTEEGEVILKVSKNDNERIRFEVEDTGIGIPEDKIDLVFEGFKQIANEHTVRAGGTGLGLSISKHLVDLMGGDLNAKSKVEKGTSFYFTIPLEASKFSHTEIQKHPLEASLGLNILLVEDTFANQEIAKGFLGKWGIKVDVVNNGKEALELIPGKKYDLVLMDVRMPVLDGYETTKRIRQMKDLYFQELPIIALTASTVLESRTKMEAAGMNDIISKPFKPEDLYEKVTGYTKSEVKKPLLPEEKQENSLSQFKFLSHVLGNDEEKVHQIVGMTLEAVEEGTEKSREAFKSKNRSQAHDHLHKMKSHLANLDMVDLADKIPNHEKDDFWDKLPGFLEKVEKKLYTLKHTLEKV